MQPIPDPLDHALFARYVKALALLCECLPFVDDPEVEDTVGDLLRDAAAAYPIDVRCEPGHCQIALRDACTS